VGGRENPEQVMSKRKKQVLSMLERVHGEKVQKGIAHWDKQNNDVPAPNCMLKVQGKIIKVEGL